jgi:hypothetical protein
MGKDGKRIEERKTRKERKEREQEEKRLSRQRASSYSSSASDSDLVATVISSSGRLRADSAASSGLLVPSLSDSGASLEQHNDGEGLSEAVKTPSSFLLDQMSTMLALMNGHHEHEMARLSMDGLLATLKKVTFTPFPIFNPLIH